MCSWIMITYLVVLICKKFKDELFLKSIATRINDECEIHLTTENTNFEPQLSEIFS